MSFMSRLVDFAELRALSRLAFPIVFIQVGMMFMGVVDTIMVGHLSPQIRKVEGTLARIAPKKGTLKEMMDQVERWLITEALREHDNNKTRTAVTLGITREGLHKKLSRW